MCGIAGAFGRGDLTDHVARMTRCIAHRGRDGEGLAPLCGTRGDAGALGHRRLSVLDLTDAGAQPMRSADGRYTIVFNGEIYNFQGIRDDLERAGARFRGHSDTEVILEGWARRGPAIVSEFRGMFAFALWDAVDEVAYLVRDPFGIKPLYVHATPERLVFASEVRGLLAAGDVPRVLDTDAIAGFLALGAVPEPRTIVRGVRALPAGTITRVVLGERDVEVEAPREYARALEPLPAGERPLRGGDAAKALRTALADSVAHHLVSDVPVACFLSGGVDSSAIAALAAQAQAGPLATFTIGYRNSALDEAPIARELAKRYHTDHHEVALSGDDLFAALPSAFEAMDQPSMDGVNTYVVSRAVHDAGIKVVMSGLGGDELFAGYPSFARARWLARANAVRVPGADALMRVAGRLADRTGKSALLWDAGTPEAGAYRASRTLFAPDFVARLAGRAASVEPRPAPEALSPLQRVSWYELNGYMRDVLLRDSDVFSMAHHLELRVPFIDREVARASVRVADDEKLRGGRGKAVLIEAVKDLIPRAVWDRPKQGFTLPFADWMRGALHAEVAAALCSPERLSRVGLAPEVTRVVWEGFLHGRPGLTWSRSWALYTLVRWAEELDVSVHADASAALAPAALEGAA